MSKHRTAQEKRDRSHRRSLAYLWIGAIGGVLGFGLGLHFEGWTAAFGGGFLGFLAVSQTLFWLGLFSGGLPSD